MLQLMRSVGLVWIFSTVALAQNLVQQGGLQFYVFQGERVTFKNGYFPRDPLRLTIGGQVEPCERSADLQGWDCAVPQGAALGVQPARITLVEQGTSGQITIDLPGKWLILPEAPVWIFKPTNGRTETKFQFKAPTAGLLPQPSYRALTIQEISRALGGEMDYSALADGNRLLLSREQEKLLDNFLKSRGQRLGPLSPLILEPFEPVPLEAIPLPQLQFSIPQLRPLVPGQALQNSIQQLRNTLTPSRSPTFNLPFDPVSLRGISTDALRAALAPARLFQVRVLPQQAAVATVLRRLEARQQFVPSTCFEVPYRQVSSGIDREALRLAYQQIGLGAWIVPTKEPSTGGELTEVKLVTEEVGKAWNNGVVGMMAAPNQPDAVTPAQSPSTIVYLLDTYDGVSGHDAYIRTIDNTTLSGHGSHMASYLKSVGVSARQIRAVPVCDDQGRCDIPKIMLAVCAAAAEAAQGKSVLVNMSFTTPLPGSFLKEVMVFASNQGVRFVAAHGNVEVQFPQQYTCDKLSKDDVCHQFPADWTADSTALKDRLFSVAPLSCDPQKKSWVKSEYARVALNTDIRNVAPDYLLPGLLYYPHEAGGRAPARGSSFATAIATAWIALNGTTPPQALLNQPCNPPVTGGQ